MNRDSGSATNDEQLQVAIALLTHAHSPRRRSGAQRLRRLRDRRAGSALLAALQREMRDPRTWETQYQMIMALAECEVRESLPLLHALANRRFEATMLYVALGDAIVRLEHQSPKTEMSSSG